MLKLKIISIIILLLSTHSCISKIGKQDNISHYDSISTKSSTNSDSIATITIGEQEWLLEEVSQTSFQNGDSITVYDAGEWNSHRNDTIPIAYKLTKVSKNGNVTNSYYYNWFAASDSRQIPPDGFSVPTIIDYKILIKNIKEQYGTLQVLWDSTYQTPNNIHILNLHTNAYIISEIMKHKDVCGFWTRSSKYDYGVYATFAYSSADIPEDETEAGTDFLDMWKSVAMPIMGVRYITSQEK